MSFGRKGLDFDAARGSLEGFTNPAPRHVEDDVVFEDDGEGLSRKLKFAAIAIGVILFVLTIDAIAAGTGMITPLPEGASFYATATGAALGLLIGGYLWFTSDRISGVRATLGMFLGVPLFVGAWANMMLWRSVEHAEFDFTDAQWERAAYPVLSFDMPSRRGFGLSRHAVEIDPFDVGGNTDIPVPEWQFDAYWPGNDQLCVVVEQRRSASGAIQVKTDGTLNLNAPEPVEFVSC